LIDVFLIGKFQLDFVKDLFHGDGPVASFPHGRAKLIKMSRKDIVPSYHVHEFLTKTTRKLRDLDQYKTILAGCPLKIKSLWFVLEKLLDGR